MIQEDSRYVFNASAFGIGGRITEPYLRDFKVQAPTTLPTVGGLAHSEVSRASWQDVLSFDSLKSMVRGGGPPPNERVSVASAEVVNLEVEGRLRVAHAQITIRAHEDPGDEQPSVVPDQTEISGVTIDGCRVTVVLDPRPFQEHPTKASLKKAFGEAKFREAYGGRFLRADKKTSEESLPECHRGLVLATIVKEIKVEHQPGCRRHHGELDVKDNRIIIPNFGRVYFGELIIADTYRRLNAFRLKLGSPTQGDVEVLGVGSNGGGVP